MFGLPVVPVKLNGLFSTEAVAHRYYCSGTWLVRTRMCVLVTVSTVYDSSTSVMWHRNNDYTPCVHFWGVLSVHSVVATHHMNGVTSSVQHRGVHCSAHVLFWHHVPVRAGRQHQAGQDHNQDWWDWEPGPPRGRHVVCVVLVASKLSGKQRKSFRQHSVSFYVVFVFLCPVLSQCLPLFQTHALCTSLSNLKVSECLSISLSPVVFKRFNMFICPRNDFHFTELESLHVLSLKVCWTVLMPQFVSSRCLLYMMSCY